MTGSRIALTAIVAALALTLATAPYRPGSGAPRPLDDLEKRLERVATTFHGQLGYSLHHLKRGHRLSRLGDAPFPTASTIKVAMLCAAMEKNERGELGYYDLWTVPPDARSQGTGFMKHYREGAAVRVKEVLHMMITASDNTATNMLGQRLGAAAVNDWLTRRGFNTTRLTIPWPLEREPRDDMKERPEAWEEFKKWGMGVTTPTEMATLMEMILDRRAGSSAACDEMHRILNHQYFDDGIAGQVPPSVAVASKSGVEKHSRSDVAIVHSPSGDYVLSVYTKEAKDVRISRDNEQDSAIRSVARAVWEHYHPEHLWSPPPGTARFSTGPDW